MVDSVESKSEFTREKRHQRVVEALKNRARRQRTLALWSAVFLVATVGFGVYLILAATEQLKNTADPKGDFVFQFLPRLTLIMIVMFMAQFFLTVFRYAVLMASHNEVRSDVLLLAGPQHDCSLSELMTAIAPDRIDFGRPPKVPAEYLVEMGKAASATNRKI